MAAVPHAVNIPGVRGRWQPYLMQVIYLVGGGGGSRTLCSCNIPGERGRWQPYLMQLQYTWCEGQVAAVPYAAIIYLVGGTLW